MKKYFIDNEPISSLLHLIGFFLSIAGLVLLIVTAVKNSGPWHLVTFSVFGFSLIMLYLASTLYHFVPQTSRFKKILRMIDLSLIFFLIAGTYTPILLVAMRGITAWVIFGIVWFFALTGIMIQVLEIKVKIWVNVVMYLFMGWIAVFTLPDLSNVLSWFGVLWLIAGGVFYTVGVMFLALESFISRRLWFGAHDIFHLFVLAGSFSHFWLIYNHITYVAY